MLAGNVIGLLTRVTATALSSAGRPVPFLTEHVIDHLGVHVSLQPHFAACACADFYRSGDSAAAWGQSGVLFDG